MNWVPTKVMVGGTLLHEKNSQVRTVRGSFVVKFFLSLGSLFSVLTSSSPHLYVSGVTEEGRDCVHHRGDGEEGARRKTTNWPSLQRTTSSSPAKPGYEYYSLGPPTEEASLLLEHSNIRFASCVPF